MRFELCKHYCIYQAWIYQANNSHPVPFSVFFSLRNTSFLFLLPSPAVFINLSFWPWRVDRKIIIHTQICPSASTRPTAAIPPTTLSTAPIPPFVMIYHTPLLDGSDSRTQPASWRQHPTRCDVRCVERSHCYFLIHLGRHPLSHPYVRRCLPAFADLIFCLQLSNVRFGIFLASTFGDPRGGL